MVSKNLQASVSFVISRSPKLLWAIHLLHGLAILACWLNALETIGQIMLSAVLLAFWGWQYKQLRNRRAIQLRYSPSDGWAISTAGQEYQAITFKPTSVINKLLIVLHYTDINRHFKTLLIVNDSMPDQDYRRLLVLLKISGLAKKA